MERTNDLIEEILTAHSEMLRGQYHAYRNHVYRVYNLTLMLNSATEINKEALSIAAAFHDIGIWTNDTLDYLDPSIALAKAFAVNKSIKSDEIENIISFHHKLTSYKSASIVEAFRKADLIDLSFGIISFGVQRAELQALKASFPFAGFQKFIFRLILKNFIKHPLNPLPILKL